MQISQTIHYSMVAPVRFYYSITTHTPVLLPVLIVYGLYSASNPFEVIIQVWVDIIIRIIEAFLNLQGGVDFCFLALGEHWCSWPFLLG